MQKEGLIVSPSISQLLDRMVDCAAQGRDAAIIGPTGSGLSSIGDLLSYALSAKGIFAARLDCRAPGSWQDGFREICQSILESPPSRPDTLVMLVDHASDLAIDQIASIQDTVGKWKGKPPSTASSAAPSNESITGRVLSFLRATFRRVSQHIPKHNEDRRFRFRSQVWIGNLDCHSLEEKSGISLAAEPRYVFQMPEYNSEHLLSLYATIGKRQECEWGEAILHTLLDWCGTDLALAESLGAQFYGDWRSNIYDEAVAECIARWLKSDALIAQYRHSLAHLGEPTKAYIRLLNSGGKIPSHSPYCNQEPDGSIRDLFMSGLISTNLLPGFYQYRNLTIRLLALQSEPEALPFDALDLLRKYSNGRIGAILQDTELSLRHLMLHCFSRMGYDAARNKLMNTRIDEQAVPTDLRKSLQDWAKTTGGSDRQQEISKHLTQYTKDFDSRRNLWTRICDLYCKDLGLEPGPDSEPPLAKAVSYMTFGELSSLLLSLDSFVFQRWTGGERDKDPLSKRWLGYVALMRRLRNDSAHLRNIAFQDVEDLLITVREIRRDIEKYA